MKKLHSVPAVFYFETSFLLFFLPLTQAHTRFIPHLFTPFSQSACVCTINPSWPFIFNCHTLYLILMSPTSLLFLRDTGGMRVAQSLVYMTGSAPLVCPIKYYDIYANISNFNGTYRAPFHGTPR